MLLNKTNVKPFEPQIPYSFHHPTFPPGFLKRELLVEGCRETHSPLLFFRCQLLGGRGRGAAMLAVFLVSAVVHEYIFCFVLGFFYPVMLMLFLVIGGELGVCATAQEVWLLLLGIPD